MNNVDRRLLEAAVFHFVHPVKKRQLLKTSQVDTKLCQLPSAVEANKFQDVV